MGTKRKTESKSGGRTEFPSPTGNAPQFPAFFRAPQASWCRCQRGKKVIADLLLFPTLFPYALQFFPLKGSVRPGRERRSRTLGYSAGAGAGPDLKTGKRTRGKGTLLWSGVRRGQAVLRRAWWPFRPMNARRNKSREGFIASLYLGVTLVSAHPRRWWTLLRVES